MSSFIYYELHRANVVCRTLPKILSPAIKINSTTSVMEDRRWTTASHLRGCEEETHYERQRKVFHIPLYIRPSTTSTDISRLLEFRDSFGKNTARSLENLTSDDCRLFCWKDCAIYGNAGLTGKDHFAILDAVYREWFPHRDREQDLGAGNFFAKFMRFVPEAGGLGEILGFHNSLCNKLVELETEIPDTEPVNPAAAYTPLPRPKVAYSIRPTFLRLFIVLNAGWQNNGVLLLFRDRGEAMKYGCEEGDGMTTYDSDDCGDLGQARAFQCSLQRAMQMVVSIDPARALRRTEYNEMLEETLGDGDGDGSNEQKS